MHGRGVVECFGAAVGDRPNDVTLGQNSQDAALDIGNDDGADAARSENFRNFSQGPVRLRRLDLTALGSKYARHSHFTLLFGRSVSFSLSIALRRLDF